MDYFDYYEKRKICNPHELVNIISEKKRVFFEIEYINHCEIAAIEIFNIIKKHDGDKRFLNVNIDLGMYAGYQGMLHFDILTFSENNIVQYVCENISKILNTFNEEQRVLLFEHLGNNTIKIQIDKLNDYQSIFDGFIPENLKKKMNYTKLSENLNKEISLQDFESKNKTKI